MANEIIERVARVIEAKIVEQFSGTLGLGDNAAKKIARAVIETMKEPTEAMRRFGGSAFDANVYMGGASQRGKDKADNLWRGMIDEALRDRP